jgi:hypothetical protein
LFEGKEVRTVAITCPGCGRQYDITLFQFGHHVVCECGEVVTAEGSSTPARGKGASAPKADQVKKAKAIARLRMAKLQRAADRVCSLILISDYPEIDIELEKANVRRLAEELFPERMDLYEMIYESRFRRLWEQFRCGSDDTTLYETGRWGV